LVSYGTSVPPPFVINCLLVESWSPFLGKVGKGKGGVGHRVNGYILTAFIFLVQYI
jgi:hypothetical protein